MEPQFKRVKKVIEREVCDKPKPAKRKPFVLETKYIGTSSFMPAHSREWHTWKRYETLPSAERALKSMSRNSRNIFARNGVWKWEYRIVEDR